MRFLPFLPEFLKGLGQGLHEGTGQDKQEKQDYKALVEAAVGAEEDPTIGAGAELETEPEAEVGAKKKDIFFPRPILVLCTLCSVKRKV